MSPDFSIAQLPDCSIWLRTLRHIVRSLPDIIEGRSLTMWEAAAVQRLRAREADGRVGLSRGGTGARTGRCRLVRQRSLSSAHLRGAFPASSTRICPLISGECIAQ